MEKENKMNKKKYYDRMSIKFDTYAKKLYAIQQTISKAQQDILTISDRIGEDCFNVIVPFLPDLEAQDNPKIGYVYFLKAGNFYKIGHSRSIKIRIGSLQTGCPHKIELAGVVAGGSSFEKHLHKRFKKHKVNGEWFNVCDEISDFIAYNKSKQLKIGLEK